jgi:hypothetical protein
VSNLLQRINANVIRIDPEGFEDPGKLGFQFAAWNNDYESRSLRLRKNVLGVAPMQAVSQWKRDRQSLATALLRNQDSRCAWTLNGRNSLNLKGVGSLYTRKARHGRQGWQA